MMRSMQMIAWFAETFTDAPGQAFDATREHRVKTFHSSDEMDSGVGRPVSKMVVDAS
jgi:hypothetical protein